MSTLSRFPLLALLLATAAPAETFTAPSKIIAVTLYPQGAEITREITLTAPPGAHELIVPDLPADLAPGRLRLASTDAALGAFALRSDRLPPPDPQTETALAEARSALAKAEADLATIAAEIEAQEAAIAFLSRLQADATGQSPESLAALSASVTAQTRAARQAAITAATDRPAAEAAVEAARAQLDMAQSAAETDRAALTLSLTTTAPSARITLTHFLPEAGWRPVYDLHLDGQTLTLDRGLLITQAGHEDWPDIRLTLSTAQPGAQAEPSRLWPELRRSLGHVEPQAEALATPEALTADAPADAMPAPEVTAMPPMLEAEQRGATLVYTYPQTVSVAAGVEDLRLALDSHPLPAELLAIAVPRQDQTAFLQAHVTNDTQEPLLPGQAFLYRDGMLVATRDLPLLPPGEGTDLGFGALPEIRLTRSMPERMSGDRGVFTTKTELTESAEITVENLGKTAWDMEVIDQVPYSEQEELKINFKADPPPDVTDLDGQRGILAWRFPLSPEARRVLRLETKLSWPEGKVLQ
jgi:uncharacterized protein (TIGR02231 family)